MPMSQAEARGDETDLPQSGSRYRRAPVEGARARDGAAREDGTAAGDRVVSCDELGAVLLTEGASEAPALAHPEAAIADADALSSGVHLKGDELEPGLMGGPSAVSNDWEPALPPPPHLESLDAEGVLLAWIDARERLAHHASELRLWVESFSGGGASPVAGAASLRAALRVQRAIDSLENVLRAVDALLSVASRSHAAELLLPGELLATLADDTVVWLELIVHEFGLYARDDDFTETPWHTGGRSFVEHSASFALAWITPPLRAIAAAEAKAAADSSASRPSDLAVAATWLQRAVQGVDAALRSDSGHSN